MIETLLGQTIYLYKAENSDGTLIGYYDNREDAVTASTRV